jgi:hypothetical protein
MTLGHVVVGIGVVGLMYDALGGGTGTDAISADNLLQLAVAVLLPPIVANISFYGQLGLAGVLPRTDVKLTVRWEAVVSAAGAVFARVLHRGRPRRGRVACVVGDSDSRPCR